MNLPLFFPAPATAPHATTGNNVARVMLTVVATLAPATLFGFWQYGWPAIDLWFVTVVSALAGEALCLRLAERRALPTLADGSALLIGWLLALSLPPWVPWRIGGVVGFFATVIAKQVFGGLGYNLFNPAMVARVFLLVSFPVPMTAWIAPLPITAPTAPGFHDGLIILFSGIPQLDGVASASLLGFAKTELSRGIDLFRSLAETGAPLNSFAGMRAGSLGETASLLIAGNGLVLLGLRIISWHIPVAMLGAFFIATDYVTSPNTKTGLLVFGAGCGLLTYVIRIWGGYPEGVAFAVLIMNELTPVIDRYLRPRILGRDQRGAPLDPASQQVNS